MRTQEKTDERVFRSDTCNHLRGKNAFANGTNPGTDVSPYGIRMTARDIPRRSPGDRSQLHESVIRVALASCFLAMCFVAHVEVLILPSAANASHMSKTEMTSKGPSSSQHLPEPQAQRRPFLFPAGGCTHGPALSLKYQRSHGHNAYTQPPSKG